MLGMAVRAKSGAAGPVEPLEAPAIPPPVPVEVAPAAPVVAPVAVPGPAPPLEDEEVVVLVGRFPLPPATLPLDRTL